MLKAIFPKKSFHRQTYRPRKTDRLQKTKTLSDRSFQVRLHRTMNIINARRTHSVQTIYANIRDKCIVFILVFVLFSAVPTAKDEDQTYMAIIIGVLMAVIILLAVAIFLIVSRHRQRKCFASPLVGKSALSTGGNGGCPGMSSGSSCGTGGSYKDAGTGSSVSHHGNSHPASSVNGGGHLHDMDRLIQLDTEPYQEPYHAHTPFYSYSTVVVGRNMDSGSE